MSRSEPLALNETQLRAARHGSGEDGGGPLLIIAGAGTGKTATLAHRVAELVRGGAKPERMLLITFSRRAAAELERRAGSALAAALGRQGGDAPLTFPWSGTFHAVGARILREYAERIGLAANFTIHDRGDAEDLMALVRHDLLANGRDAGQSRFPGAATSLAIYSRSVNAQASLREVLRDAFPWCAAHAGMLTRLFAGYVEAKQAQQVLDFDDLLLYWAMAMEEGDLAAEIGARFDCVLVDEYQDTNRLQAAILRALKPDGRGVTVVGDDAQAIYSFRAATVRNILDFPSQYDPPAEVIALERNYRSTAPILDAANALIAAAGEGYAKTLASARGDGERPRFVTVADEAAQARFVADEVLRHRELGVDLRRQSVLFRTSAHSAMLELELARRDVPFVKYGGLRFLEASHVKDLLSALRWIENPRARIAGFRALRLMPGVGPATATRWLDALDAASDTAATMRGFTIPAAASQAWPELLRVYLALHRQDSPWPGEMDLLLDWYAPRLAERYDDAPLREPDLAQLRRVAATYPSRERFLAELTLDPPAATSARAGPPLLDEDWLTLSTIHSAKGQEWKVVQVLSCVDGCIPSDMATGRAEEIDEERRLLYVAMTRARDHLTLVLPQRYYVRQQAMSGDRHVYAQPSRFLTSAVRRCLTDETWPPRVEAAAKPATPARGAIDLRARARLAWTPADTPQQTPRIDAALSREAD
ncbi:MAG: ATP-dependent helicase [Proteobacteria bacterium]|nr:ATP-dependent helicase [Pseudomonadota bacterium]